MLESANLHQHNLIAYKIQYVSSYLIFLPEFGIISFGPSYVGRLGQGQLELDNTCWRPLMGDT